MKRVRIGLVDDHVIVREGLKALFYGLPEMEVAGSFNNGQELFIYLKTRSLDLVLLDISMPGLSGTEVAKILNNRYPKIRVIMLSALTDQDSIEASIKAGAAGFLPKETNSDELRRAIKEVLAGKRYFSQGKIAAVFDAYIKNLVSSSENPEYSVLTERELEIVKLFTNGLLYKEVADLLTISIKTVEAHKANIMRKLELHSTAGLVKYAIREKIITL